jgi:hypothetical protein
VPSELDEIHMLVNGPGGVQKDVTATLGEGQPALPRSLGLVHQAGPLNPVEIHVQGRKAGALVVERRANVAFIKGRTLVMPMHLAASCIGVVCDPQTCTEYGCAPIDIDPETLASWSGDEPRLFEDDGEDAGGAGRRMDAGRPDSGSQPTENDGSTFEPTDAGESDAAVGVDSGIICETIAERCNGVDDNCNDQVDEGFDLSTNTMHCGSCGNRCTGQTRMCCAGTCQKSCQ